MELKHFLYTPSFEHRNSAINYSLPLLIERIDALSEIDGCLAEAGESWAKCDCLYNSEIIPGTFLYQMLYEEGASPVSFEMTKTILLIIDRATTVDCASAHQLSATLAGGVPACNMSLIYFYRASIQNTMGIFSKNEIIQVRRIYLAFFCPDVLEFLRSSSKPFPNLYFHPSVEQSVKTLSCCFTDFLPEIVRHLSALNDYFKTIFDDYQSSGLTEITKRFSTSTGIECTLEGDLAKKQRLKFDFTNDQGQALTLICEPHTKLTQSGLPGDNTFRFDRIYFHQGKPDIAEGKILIAHIGEHL